MATLEMLFFLTLSFLLFTIASSIHHLVFHPLAKFKGPKLAVLMPWYESYHSMRGRFHDVIAEMHREHGEIVRVSRDELVIQDPDFYPEVYTTRRYSSIPPRSRAGTGTEGSVGVTESHTTHDRRRLPIQTFYSPRKVTQLQPRIETEVDNFVRHLQDELEAGHVVNLDHMFTTLSGNILARLSLPRPEKLMRPYGSAEWYETVQGFFRVFVVFIQLPYLRGTLNLLPRRLLRLLCPAAAQYQDMLDSFHQQIEDASRLPCAQDADENLSMHLLQSTLPPAEKHSPRLAAEVISASLGGIGSIALVLTLATFHIMHDRDVRSKLENCLRAYTRQSLEGLARNHHMSKPDFLHACWMEALRLTDGTLGRSPRCAAEEMTYKGWTVPKGTAVSVVAQTMHMDETVFHQPRKFDPDRWLVENPSPLYKSMVSFGRGSRNCPAQGLAHAVVKSTLARLFRPEGPRMSLYHTQKSDVHPVRDYVLPMRSEDGRGLRVVAE